MQSNTPRRRTSPPVNASEKQSAIEAVFCHVADGLTLTEIEKLPGMPKRQTLNSWIATNKNGLAERYAQAREVRADRIADEIFAIADGCNADTPAEVQKARLQVEARKWFLAKLMPEKYGDSSRIELKSRIVATPPQPTLEEIIEARRMIDEAIKDDTE